VTGFKAKADPGPAKSGASLKAAGINLTLPETFGATQFFNMNPFLTVQLRNDAGGCWSSNFTQAQASKNNGTMFKAVGP
jgi:hypothetical protein